MMYIVPYFDNNKEKIEEGDVYTSHTYCQKNSKTDRCRNFYKMITEPGFYTCPNGYTTFVSSIGLANNIFYTSLLIQGSYDKKKLKGRSDNKNKFSKDEISRLLGLFEAQQRQTQNTEKTVEDEANLIRGILHEVRRLSREINSQRTELLRNVINEDEKVSALVDNIYATSQLISIRIDSYELYKNPSAITSAIQSRIPVYKRFDKARFIIGAQAKAKKININFSGESHFTIEGFEIFDLLPYIILDNAVKYTQCGMEVNVIFDDNKRIVTIQNIGPQVPRNQLENLFEKGFRGQNSKTVEGNGLGLYMAKQIADLHKIKCYTRSSDTINFHLDNIPYSEFKMVLDFNK